MLGIVDRPYQNCLALAITAMSVAVGMGAVTGVSAQEVPILVEPPRWYPASAGFPVSQVSGPPVLVSDGIDKWRGFWTTPSGYADDYSNILAIGENEDCGAGWRDWEYQEAQPNSTLTLSGVDGVPGGTWAVAYESYWSPPTLLPINPQLRSTTQTWVLRSRNGGITWAHPRPVSIPTNRPLEAIFTWTYGHRPEIAVDGNGNWLLVRKRSGFSPPFQQDFTFIESRVSTDDAATWSLPSFSQRFYQLNGSDIQLLGSADSFLLSSNIECKESVDLCGPLRGTGNPRLGTAILRTEDFGKSWEIVHEVWGKRGHLYKELGGRILYWSVDCPESGNCTLSIDYSMDHGETWTEGLKFPAIVSDPELLEFLSDGRGNMILYWTESYSNGAISAICSTDDGGSWSEKVELRLEDYGFAAPQRPDDFDILHIAGATDGRGLWRLLFVVEDSGEVTRIPDGLYTAGWRFGDEAFTEGESTEEYYPECNYDEYPPIERPVLACGATGFEDGAWLPLGDLVVVLLAFVALWKGSSWPLRSISTGSRQ